MSADLSTVVARITTKFVVPGTALPSEVPIDPLEFGEFDDRHPLVRKDGVNLESVSCDGYSLVCDGEQTAFEFTCEWVFTCGPKVADRLANILSDPTNTDPGIVLFDLSVEDENGRSWDLDGEPVTVCRVTKKYGGAS